VSTTTVVPDFSLGQFTYVKMSLYGFAVLVTPCGLTIPDMLLGLFYLEADQSLLLSRLKIF